MISTNLRTLDVRPRFDMSNASQLAASSRTLTEHGQERGFILTVRSTASAKPTAALLEHSVDEAMSAARPSSAKGSLGWEAMPTGVPSASTQAISAPGVRWVSHEGEDAIIGGESFRLSLCYVGPGLEDPANPTVIDPSLEVGAAGCDLDRVRLEFAGYAGLSSAERRHYLEWNRGGRRGADVPRAFLLLFLSTLEHAIVRDRRSDLLAAARAELARLSHLHSTDPIFCNRAERLIEACGLVDPSFRPAIIDPRIDPNFRSEMPFNVRHYLGWMLKTYDRLEADGGLLFYLQQPETRIVPSVWQHLDQLQNMWALQFPYAGAAEFSRSSELPRLKLAYKPLNGDFACVFDSDLPDVAALTVTPKLRQLYDSCVQSIAHLKHHRVGSIIANMPVIEKASLLPRGRFDPKPGATQRLAALVPGAQPRPIEVSQLLQTLVDCEPLKPNKLLPTKRSELVTELLDDQGFGFEPDLRFGMPNCLRPDHRVVLFRAEKLPYQGPSEAYLLAQAAVVLSAWGEIWPGGLEPLQLDVLEERLPSRHRFSDREFRRLDAARLSIITQPNARKLIERWVHHLFRDKRESDLIGAFTVAYRGQRRNPALAKLARFISMNCPTPLDDDIFLEAAAATTPPAEAFHVGLGDRVRALQEPLCVAPDAADTIEQGAAPQPVTPLALDGLGQIDAELLLALYDRARSRGEFVELARSRRVTVPGAIERINEWGFIHLGCAAIAEGETIAVSLGAREYVDRRIQP